MAAAAAAPAPAAHPVTAAITRFTAPRAPRAGFGPLDVETLETPRDNPAVTSLKFIDWLVPPAPALPSAPVYILTGVFLAAATFSKADADRVAFEAASLVEDECTAAMCSAFCHELGKANLFDKTYDDQESFYDAVAESTRLDRAALTLRLAHIRNTESFDAPGGGPAGPPELLFLHRVSWWKILQEGAKVYASRPCYLLGQLFIFLGAKSRRNTRADDTSELRISGEMLQSWVRRTPPALDPAASESVVARKTPTFLAKASQHLLAAMRSTAASIEAAREDLGDAFVLIAGREAEISSTLWRRAFDRIDSFYTLSAFKPLMGNAAELKVQLERLAGHYTPTSRSANPFVMMLELERKLVERGKRTEIVDLLSAHSDFSAVVTAILASSEISSGPAHGVVAPASTGDSSGAGTGVGSGSLQASRADQAISAMPFRQAVEACTNDNLTGRAFLERCFRSGSAILHRYGAFAPAWLRSRHAFFETFHAQLHAKREYLSHAVTLDADTAEVPGPLLTFLLPEEQCNLFFTGRWLQMDAFNQGFMLVRAKQHATSYLPVDPADFYVVESCLVGFKSYFTRLLLAVNYPEAPATGYSCEEVVDKQISVIQFIQGLPDAERPDWYAWARSNFIEHALGRAQSIYLEFVEASIPAEARLDYFLPADAAFFSNINHRMKQAEPISTVRQAFPLLFASTPIALPGTSAGQSGSGGGGGTAAGGGGKVEGGGGGGGGGGGLKDGKKKASVIHKMLDENTLFLAGYVYDVGAAAKELKVDVKSLCWPRLFTTKKGAEAAALCGIKSHGAAEHTIPKGFNREAFAKKYSQKASTEQCQEAGWFSSPNKKKKI